LEHRQAASIIPDALAALAFKYANGLAFAGVEDGLDQAQTTLLAARTYAILVRLFAPKSMGRE